MKFGVHVSIAGGVFNAPKNAADVGCEVFQIFTRSPRGGNAPELTDEILGQFNSEMKKYRLKNFYVHAPYYINLASENDRTYYGSIDILKKEIIRADKLGAQAMMVHLGSGDRLSRNDAINRVSEGLVKILKTYNGKTKFLIEIAAGAGNVMGDTFEEVASFISKTEKKVKTKIGVCFDTAHAFASGYDLRTEKKVVQTFKIFDSIIGLDRLALIHGNDSKVEFGGRKDRHEHLGKGKIGIEGFTAIVKHPKLKKVDIILETPKEDDMDKKNLAILKKLRSKK